MTRAKASGSSAEASVFPSQALLGWYRGVRRDLPWRETGDPYAIWISEIMLQQTQVATVIPYYERWMRTFPTIASLADADQDSVLRAWEGLGYYRRARHAHATAQRIVEEFGGVFPSDPSAVASLKGIGPYTAAAICSIAFGADMAALDGNVMRVLSRWFLIEADLRRSSTQTILRGLAEAILPAGEAGDFNQAMMELGATVCRPAAPACRSCPVSAGCGAFMSLRTDELPYKSPAKRPPHHTIVIGILEDGLGRVLITRRPDEAMLGGLWEFPGGKVEPGESLEEALRRELLEELGVEAEVEEAFHTLDHAYSHFTITLHAFRCRLSHTGGPPSPRTAQEMRWVGISDLDAYPFPKANRTLTLRLMSDAGSASVSEP